MGGYMKGREDHLFTYFCQVIKMEFPYFLEELRRNLQPSTGFSPPEEVNYLINMFY